MGLDGFSLSNLGLNKNLTSAQLANEVDATARQSLENQIADVDGVGKREKVGKKDEDAAFNGTIPFIPDDKNENNETSQQEQQEEQNNQSVEDYDDDDSDDTAGDFHFKIDDEGMIEVWDTQKNVILKKITVDDASKVFHSFTRVPGIFVNKEI